MGQALTRISLILCVVLTSFLFVPHLGLFSSRQETPVSISPVPNSYAILPVLLRTGENLGAAKTRNDVFGKRTPAPETANAWSLPLLSVNFCALIFCVCSFNSIFVKDFRQACQILDIPPPSSAVIL